MRVENRGDSVTIKLNSGHSVTYDGTKAKRLTGNDLHRFIGQIVASAIDSVIPASGPVDAATAGPAINSPWSGKLPPITNPDIVVEEPYHPSGLSQDDED